MGERKLPPVWEVEWRVIEICRDVTDEDRARLRPESRLLEDLGLDSLDLVEFLLAIEEGFDVTIPDAAAQRMFTDEQPVTLRRVAALVLQQWHTRAPARSKDRTPRPPLPPAESVPFTQLGGRSGQDDGPLHEPIGPNREGWAQFRRRTDGMRCVLVPEADVCIGSDAPDALPDQRPAHRVRLGRFLIDAEPVSVAAYARFLNAVGGNDAALVGQWCGVASDDKRGEHFPLRRARGGWQPVAGTERQPMILVSWYGANAYALWANRRDWRGRREDGSCLPTEAQWEYAARGAAPRRYPWGDEAPTPERLRVARHVPGATYAADALPAAAVNERLGMSPFGLHHMAGNVWQWCRDWYAPDFYARPTAAEPDAWNREPTGIRSERGGSWVGPADLARSSYRRGRPPDARGRCLGFRCIGGVATRQGA